MIKNKKFIIHITNYFCELDYSDVLLFEKDELATFYINLKTDSRFSFLNLNNREFPSNTKIEEELIHNIQIRAMKLRNSFHQPMWYLHKSYIEKLVSFIENKL